MQKKVQIEWVIVAYSLTAITKKIICICRWLITLLSYIGTKRVSKSVEELEREVREAQARLEKAKEALARATTPRSGGTGHGVPKTTRRPRNQ